MQMYQAYEEIRYSYREMKKTMDTIITYEDEINTFFSSNEIVFLGCGSSYWAVLSASKSWQSKSKMPTYCYKAADIVLASQDYKIFKNPIIIAPSRSGESKELLQALRILKEIYPNSKIFSITEFEHNQLQELSDFNISIPFVEEISICQTRSFHSLLSALYVVIGILFDNTLIHDFSKYLSECEIHYKKSEHLIKSMIEEVNDHHVVALGSGIPYGCVIEGAYIMMEMAQVNTNYFQTLEYRHGPIVCADKKTLIFLCESDAEHAMYDRGMADDIQKQGAKIAYCGASEDIDHYSYNFSISSYCEEVRGLYFTTTLQLYAYYLACKLNRNPDKPGDLVKYITY